MIVGARPGLSRRRRYALAPSRRGGLASTGTNASHCSAQSQSLGAGPWRSDTAIAIGANERGEEKDQPLWEDVRLLGAAPRRHGARAGGRGRVRPRRAHPPDEPALPPRRGPGRGRGELQTKRLDALSRDSSLQVHPRLLPTSPTFLANIAEDQHRHRRLAGPRQGRLRPAGGHARAQRSRRFKEAGKSARPRYERFFARLGNLPRPHPPHPTRGAPASPRSTGRWRSRACFQGARQRGCSRPRSVAEERQKV